MEKIGNIWCIGRNYHEHALELNNPIPKEPIVFLKASTTIHKEKLIHIGSEHIHYELELALKLNSQLKVSHIALALDLTKRKLQEKLKQNGHPWTAAKSFPHSCPISEFVAVDENFDFSALEFQLSIDGNIRQRAKVKDMIFNIPYILNYLKQNYPLAENDIILTGTPQGVGPLHKKQQLEAKIANILSVNWEIA